jgi:hypothetical protein
VPCTLRRPTRSRAHRGGRLGPGRSAAPDEDRLVLLPSGSDTVRGSPLRGTRSSTSHRRAATENGDLERGFSPAGADCRLQGTASSPPSTAREGYRGCHSGRQRPTQCGGEGEIRTRDGLPRTAFPVRRHSPLGDLSPDTCGPARGRPVHVRARMAERAGFEPAVLSHTAFRERHHQPLGHLSVAEDTKPSGEDRPTAGLSAGRRPAGGPQPRRGGCH